MSLSYIFKKIHIYSNEDTDLDLYNGYQSFDINRVRDLILLLSQGSILKTKLLKEMFYTDQLYFKHTTVSLTGTTYYKFQYGPVPNHYEDILEYLIRNDYIEEIVKVDVDYECHIIKPKRRIKHTSLSKEEINFVNQIKDYFKDFSVKDIVEYSHKEKAFTETKMYQKISYNYSFDIDDEKMHLTI